MKISLDQSLVKAGQQTQFVYVVRDPIKLTGVRLTGLRNVDWLDIESVFVDNTMLAAYSKRVPVARIGERIIVTVVNSGELDVWIGVELEGLTLEDRVGQ